jgi:hypothetical protein
MVMRALPTLSRVISSGPTRCRPVGDNLQRDGKQGVLEFNREGERRGQREITVRLGSSGRTRRCSAMEILGEAQWRPVAAVELPIAHSPP